MWDGNGMLTFDRIRYRRHDASVFLYAFDDVAAIRSSQFVAGNGALRTIATERRRIFTVD
jgi:hypothetical protein